MNSPWFNDLEEDQIQPIISDSGDRSFFGIFNDDPAIIGANLSRPTTPFDPKFFREPPSKIVVDRCTRSSIVSESPPSVSPFIETFS